MEGPLSKKKLIRLAKQINAGERISAEVAALFLDHRFPDNTSFGKFMLRVAAWISLFFASVLVIFPEVGEKLIEILPDFFLLPERLAKALDYLWGLVGKPVKKQHLMYHLPNIIIYAFGVAGIRLLWRKIHKNNWKDQVEEARKKLETAVVEGTGRFDFAPGFSLLFAGDGDRIAKSLVLDDPTLGPTISSVRPNYSRLWGRFSAQDGEDGFEKVLDQFNAKDAGEYVLFPVVDDHLFLPGPEEYDTPPYRVEIAVRRIREFEKSQDWEKKRILIVGDREQASRFVTASENGIVESEIDRVTLNSIARTYENVTLVDPTDVTLQKIIEVADGRQILFRASVRGDEKYRAAFYHRLALLGHKPAREGSLTVGYDVTDLETEHQIVAKGHSDYLPVILSREVFDLLSERYLSRGQFIFVPRLIKKELQKLVATDKVE